jgi:hypothetical protein
VVGATSRPQAAARADRRRLQLLTPLGEGGMGVVHLARAGPAGSGSRSRCCARTSSATRRRGPGWPARSRSLSPDPQPVGRRDRRRRPVGPIPFVATRYVPALAPRPRPEEGRSGGEDLRWLARGWPRASQAVHAVGVLHRDVKPSNVLIEGRTPILIDFGLARVADDPKLTHTGWLLGTPGYLAPEILYGDDARPRPTCTRGRPPSPSPAPAAAVRPRPVDGDHGPGPPRRARPDRAVPGAAHLVEAALDPDPARRPTLRACGSMRSVARRRACSPWSRRGADGQLLLRPARRRTHAPATGPARARRCSRR